MSLYNLLDNFEQVFWSLNVYIFVCMHLLGSHGFMLMYQMDTKPNPQSQRVQQTLKNLKILNDSEFNLVASRTVRSSKFGQDRLINPENYSKDITTKLCVA